MGKLKWVIIRVQGADGRYFWVLAYTHPIRGTRVAVKNATSFEALIQRIRNAREV